MNEGEKNSRIWLKSLSRLSSADSSYVGADGVQESWRLLSL